MAATAAEVNHTRKENGQNIGEGTEGEGDSMGLPLPLIPVQDTSSSDQPSSSRWVCLLLQCLRIICVCEIGTSSNRESISSTLLMCKCFCCCGDAESFCWIRSICVLACEVGCTVAHKTCESTPCCALGRAPNNIIVK
jgi:hypothetical protein